jgi:hypothetical protein
MDRLAAFEHTVQGSTKVREREVIAQVHGAQQLAERMAGAIDPITARSAAKAFQYINLLAGFQRWFPAVGSRRIMLPWHWLPQQ